MKFRRLHEAFDNEDVFVNDNEPIPADAGISKDTLEEGGASVRRQQQWEQYLEDIALALENGDLTDKQRERLLKAEKKYQDKFAKQRQYEADHPEKYADMRAPVADLRKPEPSLAESLDTPEAMIDRYETDIDELFKFMMNKTHTDYMEGRLAANKYVEFLRSVYNSLEAVTMPDDKLEECTESTEAAPVVEAAEGKRQFKPHTIRLLKLIGSDLVEGIEDPEDEEKKPLEEKCEGSDCEEDKEELKEDVTPEVDDEYDIEDETSVEAQWDEYDDDYSMDPVEKDRAHAALYGGDREYCECGEQLAHDEWGTYCPVCNPKVDDDPHCSPERRKLLDMGFNL